MRNPSAKLDCSGSGAATLKGRMTIEGSAPRSWALRRWGSVAPPRGEGRVRLLEIPGVDLQACGGTHVRNTAEVGSVAVARIRSEGKRNKRVTLTWA